MFATLAATGLFSGCCGPAFRVCDGYGGGAAGPCCNTGCDPCNWHPGKHLFGKIGCNSGCGDLYWSDWHSQPPDCCDPCDRCGNFVGRFFTGNPCRSGCGSCCGGGGEWGGGYAGGSGCCGGAGGGYDAGPMVPTPAGGDVMYEAGPVRTRVTPSRATPTPIGPSNPPRATATRVRPSQAAAPRVRYNSSTNTARQPAQRRIRPASHETTSNSPYVEEEIVEPQAHAAPAGKPCTTCRR